MAKNGFFLVADESIPWMIGMSWNTVKQMPLYARLYHNTLVHDLETGYESYTLQKHFFALLPNKFFVCLIARVQKELRVPTCTESERAFRPLFFILSQLCWGTQKFHAWPLGRWKTQQAGRHVKVSRRVCVCVCWGVSVHPGWTTREEHGQDPSRVDLSPHHEWPITWGQNQIMRAAYTGC